MEVELAPHPKKVFSFVTIKKERICRLRLILK